MPKPSLVALPQHGPPIQVMSLHLLRYSGVAPPFQEGRQQHEELGQDCSEAAGGPAHKADLSALTVAAVSGCVRVAWPGPTYRTPC